MHLFAFDFRSHFFKKIFFVEAVNVTLDCIWLNLCFDDVQDGFVSLRDRHFDAHKIIALCTTLTWTFTIPALLESTDPRVQQDMENMPQIE